MILGESYRSSAKSKQQRNRTEEKVEEVARAVDALCVRLGVDPRTVGLDGSEGEKEGEDEEGQGEDGVRDVAQIEASRHAAAAQHRKVQEEEELKRLRSAVSVLLRLALKNGWVQGGEALDLSRILDGTDGATSGASGDGQSQKNETSPSPILDEVAAKRARELAQMSRVNGGSSRSSSEGSSSR